MKKTDYTPLVNYEKIVGFYFFEVFRFLNFDPNQSKIFSKKALVMVEQLLSLKLNGKFPDVIKKDKEGEVEIFKTICEVLDETTSIIVGEFTDSLSVKQKEELKKMASLKLRLLQKQI